MLIPEPSLLYLYLSYCPISSLVEQLKNTIAVSESSKKVKLLICYKSLQPEQANQAKGATINLVSVAKLATGISKEYQHDPDIARHHGMVVLLCLIWEAHFFKGGTDGDSRLCIKKQRTGFGFRAEAATQQSVLQRTWMVPLGLGFGGELVAKGRLVRKK